MGEAAVYNMQERTHNTEEKGVQTEAAERMRTKGMSGYTRGARTPTEENGVHAQGRWGSTQRSSSERSSAYTD